MTTDQLRNAIFLVTGSDLIAEQKDRPLAYYLKNHIDRYGGQEKSKCGIVVSDLWYLANEPVQGHPTISVGGPAVNKLSRQYWHRLPVALAVDNVFVIQEDVTGQDLRAAIWGMDHETTREAVQTFYQKGYLRILLEAAWEEPLQEHKQAGDAEEDEA